MKLPKLSKIVTNINKKDEVISVSKSIASNKIVYVKKTMEGIKMNKQDLRIIIKLLILSVLTICLWLSIKNYNNIKLLDQQYYYMERTDSYNIGG